jgi:exosortase
VRLGRPRRLNLSSPGRQLLLAGLVLLLLLGALFAPTLAWLARSWAVHPYYTHGFLMPAVALWFVWQARAGFRPGPPENAGLGLVAGGLLVHLAAGRWAAHPVSAAGLLLILVGLALLVGGRPALRAAALPVTLLALAIPLPMVERLAPPLAAAVAGSAAHAAGLLGVPVVQAGAQLSVGGGAFVVGAPCSGLRSLLALGTLAVALAGAAEGPRLTRVLLVGLAVPLAVAANWLRLTGLLWVADAFGPQRGLAVFHGPASPALFLGAAVVLVALCRRMGCEVRRWS